MKFQHFQSLQERFMWCMMKWYKLRASPRWIGGHSRRRVLGTGAVHGQARFVDRRSVWRIFIKILEAHVRRT